MIELYGFGAIPGVVDPSPFVCKIDAILRMSRLDYQLHSNLMHVRKAPKGKLPFIKDNDKVVADSELIIAYLQTSHGMDLDASLSSQQRAQAYLLRKTLDEHFYWLLVHSRWADNAVWSKYKTQLFSELPVVIRGLAAWLGRKSVLSSLQKQGLGRHSLEEIKHMADQTFNALSDVLGEAHFFFGSNPTTFDAVAYAFLSQIVCVDIETYLLPILNKHDNLTRFCARFKQLYYSE